VDFRGVSIKPNAHPNNRSSFHITPTLDWESNVYIVIQGLGVVKVRGFQRKQNAGVVINK
jgi:hypothetical protein